MAFTLADYTIAWICALPLELAAAKVVLDSVHSPLSQSQTDHNVYTLGNIGGHNVVVACLPGGVYGTISACAVVTHMRSTFPNIQFGLMVGIGGGVPGKVDIRLGDVVVSKPTATASGVIQYGYGKALPNGRFQHTGTLNKPPPVLLKAVSQVESDYMTGRNHFKNVLAEALQNEEVRKRFSRPRDDWLFCHTYDHIEEEPDCSKCDPTKLVDRPERITENNHIYYGLIASGDQVMKDARTRDRIAQDLHLDILCFEMEAAALMDELPSLVIRGICDYCDSHKNKQWQAYAALVAAAYAKALLKMVPLLDTRTSLKHVNHQHCMVPFAQNCRFVGREDEISELQGWIYQKEGPSKAAIYGLGGIGKTQIATELSYRIRKQDPSWSIFWVPCTSYESVEQAFLKIAHTIGLQDVNPAEAKERVKSYLNQENAGKWLLVFDNADDMDMWIKGTQTVPALKKFLPQSQNGRILFTTRNRILGVKLASTQVTTIMEPNEKTGLKMLENLLINHNQAVQDSATLLLQRLAFLPLAIAQAAAYINEEGISIPTYLNLMGEQESHVIELLSEAFEDDGRYDDGQNPVATTWWISFQQIRLLDPLAADYLSFMACINPRDIPQSLLPKPSSENKGIKAIGLLTAYSFISKQTEGNFLSMHRLVYLATRNWLRKNEEFGLHVLKTADHLDDVFPTADHRNQRQWREYLPHGLTLIAEDNFKDKRGNYISLIEKIGACLYQDGRYKEAEEPRVQVMETRKQMLGPEHPDTLASMDNLASTYWIQGQWKEAEELYLQVIDIRKQVLGPEYPGTLASMNNLALTYQSQGRWKEAEELEVLVMETHKQVLGPEHPDTLASMNNLALAYQIQGRWKEAEELEVLVIDIRKQVLGPEHSDTLDSMNNLALTYQSQGRWKEAEELYLQVIDIRKQVLGPEHPKTLTSMNNLASTYWNQGRWKEAEELEVLVVETHKQVLGPEHPDTLASMNNLASTYQSQGRWKKAEELEVLVMETCKQVLGPKHPDTLASMNNLASTYQSQGRWKKAEELEVLVMETCKQVLGPKHPDTLASMNNLASTYQSQGRWKEAEELYLQVIDIRKQVLGPEHPETLTSMNNLASTYLNQGRWKEAEDLEVLVIDTRKQMLGPEHPNTLASMNNLASTYWNQGRWKEAEELEVLVMNTCKQVLGPEHPDTLASMNNLASTYQSQGRWKEVEELLLQVMENHKQVLGPEHPSTLTTMNNLALVWKSQGQLQDALVLMGKCVELLNKVLGPDHPQTKFSSRVLEEWNETEHQQPQGIESPPDNEPAESPQSTLIRRPEHEQHIAQRGKQEQSASPIRQFIKQHPLQAFVGLRIGPPLPPARDLEGVD